MRITVTFRATLLDLKSSFLTFKFSFPVIDIFKYFFIKKTILKTENESFSERDKTEEKTCRHDVWPTFCTFMIWLTIFLLLSFLTSTLSLSLSITLSSPFSLSLEMKSLLFSFDSLSYFYLRQKQVTRKWKESFLHWRSLTREETLHSLSLHLFLLSHFQFLASFSLFSLWAPIFVLASFRSLINAFLWNDQVCVV